MKFTKIAAIGALISAFTIQASYAETVRVGVAAEPYPPFSAINSSGNWEGWEIDIIEAVCLTAELDCEIKAIAWDGIIPALTSNQIDVIMTSMSITEERAQKIDFTDHYYKSPAVIVTYNGSDIKGASPTDLAGKVLGVQASTIHMTYAQKHFGDSDIKVYQTQDEANQDLVSGRLDAVQADSIAMGGFLESDIGNCCFIVGSVESDDAVLGKGIGAGLRKGDDELREKLNAAIAKILENGLHETITQRYFSTSIYSE